MIALTAIISVIAGVLIARMLAQKPITLHSGTWLQPPRALAPFQLADLDGKPFGNSALLGHPSLVFFGYSSCPDVCPATLATLREVQTHADLPGLQTLFVTIDPERDTPAVLRQYLSARDGACTGLYGSRAALAPLLSSLGAAADYRGLPGGGIAVTHSATVYLIDTRGRMAAVFTPPLSAAGLSADLHTLSLASVL